MAQGVHATCAGDARHGGSGSDVGADCDASLTWMAFDAGLSVTTMYRYEAIANLGLIWGGDQEAYGNPVHLRRG